VKSRHSTAKIFHADIDSDCTASWQGMKRFAAGLGSDPLQSCRINILCLPMTIEICLHLRMQEKNNASMDELLKWEQHTPPFDANGVQVRGWKSCIRPLKFFVKYLELI
jgi:hypothetical protein